jgi:hypothetical protein
MPSSLSIQKMLWLSPMLFINSLFILINTIRINRLLQLAKIQRKSLIKILHQIVALVLRRSRPRTVIKFPVILLIKKKANKILISLVMWKKHLVVIVNLMMREWQIRVGVIPKARRVVRHDKLILNKIH